MTPALLEKPADPADSRSRFQGLQRKKEFWMFVVLSPRLQEVVSVQHQTPHLRLPANAPHQSRSNRTWNRAVLVVMTAAAWI